MACATMTDVNMIGNMRSLNPVARLQVLMMTAAFTATTVGFAITLSICYLIPLWRQAHAAEWISITCRVAASYSERGGRTQYTYTYDYRGVPHESRSASFFSNVSSTRHVIGAQLTGYIDPNDPVVFVQDRDYRPSVLAVVALASVTALSATILVVIVHRLRRDPSRLLQWAAK